jgi:hypothetical protein
VRYQVRYRGDPIAEVESLVAGYVRIREEFAKRWPRAIYGPQEAAAHGFTLVGTPELTPEEARALRNGTEMPGDRRPEGEVMAAALRQGLIQ